MTKAILFTFIGYCVVSGVSGPFLSSPKSVQPGQAVLADWPPGAPRGEFPGPQLPQPLPPPSRAV
jgi:hypothetical protein